MYRYTYIIYSYISLSLYIYIYIYIYICCNHTFPVLKSAPPWALQVCFFLPIGPPGRHRLNGYLAEWVPT